MSNTLYYPPSPAQSDSMASESVAATHARYQYHDGMEPAGLLNESGLSYLAVPLNHDLDKHLGHDGREDGHSMETVAPGSLVIKNQPSKHPRLLSLDCFRGLTIAWMIMSDETGQAFTHILDHSPWNGIHFADFVFPAFVFIVGMAIPLSTSKFANDRWGVTKKAIWRAIKMFIVGWVSASGGFPSSYYLAHTRIPGILQRIAFCYLITVIIHVWVPVREQSHTPNSAAFGRSRFALLNKYLYQFLAALGLLAIYLLLTFATNVPGCGYGDLNPDCNATRYWDQKIIGVNHMYTHPTLNRSPDCSANSPGYEPIPGRPQWCDMPFDPEGIVGTFTACITGFFGLYFGHVLANESNHGRRLQHWLSVATVCMILGLIIHFTVIPINKNLWSISYVLVMVGVDGVVFSFFYWFVDMKQWKRPVFPMICMGMNAILVFVIAQSDISVDTVLQWFYTNEPNDNLYYWYRIHVLEAGVGFDWAIILWGLTKVFAWFGISTVLNHYKIFWKL